MLPAIAGQGHQVIETSQRLGGQTDVSGLFEQHPRHLVGRALVQADLDFRIAPAQLRHRFGQHVARLRVGGGDRQTAGVLLAELVADALEVADLAQNDLDRFQHLLARLGDAAQALAMAREDVDAELFLELEDGLADAGLRGVQRLGGLGQVQAAPHRLLDEAELVQVHGVGWPKASAMPAMAAINTLDSPTAGCKV